MNFTDPGFNDWTITDHVTSIQMDAVQNAASNVDKIGGGDDETQPRVEAGAFQTLVFMYNWDDNRKESIFTPANVERMCLMDNAMLDNEEYPKFCKLLPNDAPVVAGEPGPGECARQMLAVSGQFYGSQRVVAGIGAVGFNCSRLSQAEVDTKASTLISRVIDVNTRIGFGLYASATVLDDEFTEVTRSMLDVGAPLEGYSSKDDRTFEQLAKYQTFMEKVETSLFDSFDVPEAAFFSSRYRTTLVSDGMQVRWMCQTIRDNEFTRNTNSDLVWTMASVMFVFCYLWLHTTSLWLAYIGIVQILFSLPLAFFFYRLVFQIPYYSQLHILVIFLVLGVGADDLFVFVDGWKQSISISEDEYTRLVFTFRRTTHAVFNTSFTTAMAFVATAVSPVMPVASFGIYAALAIVLNYVSVLSVTPGAVLIWHRYFADRRWGDCLRKGKAAEPVDPFALARAVQAEEAETTKTSDEPVKTVAVEPSDAVSGSAASETGSATDKAADANLVTDDPVTDTDPVALEAETTRDHDAGEGPDEVPTDTVEAKSDDDDVATPAGTAANEENKSDGAAANTDEDGADAPMTLEQADDEVTDTNEPVVAGEGVEEGQTNDDATANADATASPDATAATAESAAATSAAAHDSATPEDSAGATGNDDANSVTLSVQSSDSKAYDDAGDDTLDPKYLRFTERFFYKHYSPFINKKVGGVKVVAWTILLLSTAYFIASFVWASELSTPEKQEEWFPDDHMFNGIEDYASKSFFSSSTADYMSIRVTWGLSGVDRSDFNMWVPNENRGTAVFNDKFDLGDPAAQAALLAACATMRTFECNAPGCRSGKEPNTLILNNDVTCFMEDYQSWYQTTSGNTDLPTGQEFFDSLKTFRDSRVDYEGAIGFIDGELKYVSVSYTSSLLLLQPHSVTKPVYEESERMMDELAAAAPDTLGRAFQTTFWWTWMRTEAGLVEGMFIGFSVSFPVAFLVLCYATDNLLLALYAIISIGCIVASVLGMAKAYFGWALGIGESVSAVIVIGFSVDYVVHLGHVYADTFHLHKLATREHAVRNSLTVMGVTVLAGAATTMGSGLFMLLCQLTFFTKMAILISGTIFFSTITAFGFFMSLCALFGPTNGFMDISKMWHAARAKLCPARA